jgi:hypothetical protein
MIHDREKRIGKGKRATGNDVKGGNETEWRDLAGWAKLATLRMRISRPFLAILAICAFLHGPSGHLHGEDAKPPLYLVLFRLTAGEDGKLLGFQVEKVIDLLSGSNNAAAVKLPQSFIDRARTKVEAEHFKPAIVDGKPSSSLTTFVYSPADEKSKPPGISFGVLDGAMNFTSDLRLLNQDGQLSTFGANLGSSAIFLTYYALPLPKTRRDQREAIVEAEVQRSAANVQNAEILSRKNLSTDTQTIMEFTCKSPRNKALTIRSRYICKDDQMLGFGAITPDELPAEDIQSFDRLFEAFRFR